VRNVADQREDPASTLHLVRDVIALRRAEPDLRAGAYATVDAPAGAWAWRRGDGFLVAVNLGDAPATIDGVQGQIAIATDRGRDGEDVTGALELGPAQGAVVRRR
jgi:alpha-glucosidase